jgi:Ca2+/H+ antiporter, TMEM165/GDT1 family
VWEYVTVFVLAATPLVELLVVVPLGIGYGLHPVSVALVTFAGNSIPVLLIIAAYTRIAQWRQRRADAVAAAAEPGEPAPHDAGAEERHPDTSLAARRSSRARRLWQRYGLPGLCMLAPLVTGVHLAAIAALAMGSPRRSVVTWLLFSIGVWTAAVTVATVAGIAGLRYLL